MSKSAQDFVKSINPDAKAKHRHVPIREGGSIYYVLVAGGRWEGASAFQAWCRAAAAQGWNPQTAKEKCMVSCRQAWTHRNRLTRKIVATCCGDAHSIHGEGDTEGQAWSALWEELKEEGFSLDRALLRLRSDAKLTQAKQ